MACVVVYDACVLYPAPLRDLLIRLAAKRLVQARWTEREQLVGFARGNPAAYAYLFGHETVFGKYLKWGAYHGAEIDFVFGALRLWTSPLPPPTAAELALSDAMVLYWTNFARTGDPNGGGAAGWPRFDGSRGKYQYLGIPINTREGLKGRQCDFFDRLR